MVRLLFVGIHNHTGEGSNYRLLDATIRIKDLFEYTHELGHMGVAITDHETVGSHVEAIQTIEELKAKNPEEWKDYKLILGNEIYLCNRKQIQEDGAQTAAVKRRGLPALPPSAADDSAGQRKQDPASAQKQDPVFCVVWPFCIFSVSLGKLTCRNNCRSPAPGCAGHRSSAQSEGRAACPAGCPAQQW